MTNQDKFIEIFGDDCWKRMLVFNGTAEEFKEFWAMPYKDKSYEDGLNDAWECAREIDTNRELEDYVFGDDLDHGFDSISVIEAMIKIKKYKEKQKCKKCGHYPENGITSNAICLKCNNNDKFVEKPITTQENLMRTLTILEAENERLHDKLKEYGYDIQKIEFDIADLAHTLKDINHTTMVCDEDIRRFVALEDIRKVFDKYNYIS